jgi:hypothetical protein
MRCDGTQTERLLADVDDWDFNIFTLEEVSQVWIEGRRGTIGLKRGNASMLSMKHEHDETLFFSCCQQVHSALLAKLGQQLQSCNR